MHVETDTVSWDGEVQTATGLLTKSTDVNKIEQEVNFENNGNSSRLHTACQDGNIYLVQFFVKGGSEVEMTNSAGEACMIHAINRKHYKIVKYLLSTGARVNRYMSFGNTTLCYCKEKKFCQLLLNKGTVIRINENRVSLIMALALRGNAKMVEYLDMHIRSRDAPPFARRSLKAENDNSSNIALQEKIDAYKLIGTRCNDYKREKTRDSWLHALTLSREVGIQPVQHVNPAPSCKYCTIAEASADESNSSIAWSIVRVVARETVTGMELLHHATKCYGAKWMSKFLPSFQCPTCPQRYFVRSVMHQSVRKVIRYHVIDKHYLKKWQHLKNELQSLYKLKVDLCYIENTFTTTINHSFPCEKTVRFNRTNSNLNGQCHINLEKYSTFNKMTAMVDAILGIEPVSFVQKWYEQNDLDLQSYYLQQYWLNSGVHKPPRTTYRCSYNICIVCGHMVIKFNGKDKPQSGTSTIFMSDSTSDFVCKQCYHLYKETRKEMTYKGYYCYRSSACCTHIREAWTKNRTTAMMVCPQCVLVSEQHPNLQLLRQCSEEVFDNFREFSSEQELMKCVNDNSSFRLQKWLFSLRFEGRNDPFKILDLVTDLTWTTNIIETENLWRFNLQCLRIFWPFNYSKTVYSILRFTDFSSKMLARNHDAINDPNMIVDYFNLAIDCIEWGYQSKNKEDKHTISALFESSLQIILQILWYYLPEISFQTSCLQGLPLVTLVIEKYIIESIRENELFFKSASPLRCSTNSSNNNIEANVKTNAFSPTIIHFFINHVYRLVCLDHKIDSKGNLLNTACSLSPLPFGNKPCGRGGETLVVELLLRLGANPNQVDSNDQTVIGHVLRKRRIQQQTLHDLLAVLMKEGAHLDAYKRDGIDKCHDEKLHDFLRQFNISPVHKGKLACLAATAIKRNGLTARNMAVKTYLSNHLMKFINLH